MKSSLFCLALVVALVPMACKDADSTTTGPIQQRPLSPSTEAPPADSTDPEPTQPQASPPAPERSLTLPDAEALAALAAGFEDDLRIFSPPASDRAFWSSTPIPAAERIADAERRLGQPIPDLTEELYLDYGKTGRRPTPTDLALRDVQRNYLYQDIIINPDGMSLLEPFPAAPWSLTVQSVRQADAISELPANFSTILFNPINGTVRVLRP